MKVYKRDEPQLELGGVTYHADDNGVIDIPDGQVTSKVWANGFILADGHLAELERLRPTEESTSIVEQAEDQSSKAPVDTKPKKA